MAQDHGLCRKKVKRVKVKNEPVHGLPLQARVVAANRTVCTTCASILAHMELNRGGKAKLNGAKCAEGSRHGMAKASRHTKPAEQGRCRQTQPADDPTGTGLVVTTAADDPAGTGLAAKLQPADVIGRPLSKTTATDVGRPLAVQCRLVEGVRWCWPLRRRAQTYLPVSLPPIAFACHCTYPLP